MTETKRWWMLVLLMAGATGWFAYSTLTQPGSFGGWKVQVPLFTARSGGSFLRVGQELARLVNEDPRSALQLLPVETDGSVDNLDKISKLPNAVTFTFLRAPDVRKHADQAEHVRAIALLGRDVLQLVVSRTAGIGTLRDLGAQAGERCKHRVYVGLPESGNRAAARELTEVAGFVSCFAGWAEASQTLDYTKAADLLRSGELDAAIFATGMGAPALEGLYAEPEKFAFISLDQPTRDRLTERGNESTTLQLAAGSVSTVGGRVLVATHVNTEGWIVRELASALVKHRDQLQTMRRSRAAEEASPAALTTDLTAMQTALKGTVMTVHEGLLSRWAWLGDPWLQLLGLVGLGCAQLWLALTLKPPPPAAVAAQPSGPPAPQRVFISYESSDKEFVSEVLVPRLTKAGLQVWWSGLLPGGSDYASVISTALDGATWVVATLSPEATKSKWVRAEIARGLKMDKGVVPVIVRGPCDPSLVHFHLDGKNHIDLTDRSDAAFGHLIETLLSEPMHGPRR